MARPRQPRKNKAAPITADELRRRAEERLDKLAAAAADAASPVPVDVAAVVHDLRVHQIELEMQNEELRRTQLELQESREKYVELFDLAPVGYLTMSRESIVRDANLTAARLLGVERRQLVHNPFTAFIFAPDQDVYYRHQLMLEETGEPQTCELRLRRSGGDAGDGAEAGGGVAPRHFWARLESRPQRAGDGKSLSSWVAFSDIDETVAAQEALRESEEKYRTVADFTYDWEAWRAPDGTYRYVSPSCERITGHTAAEFLADPDLIVQVTHADDQSKAIEHYRAAAHEAQGQDLRFDFRILTSSGEIRWISHRCTAVYGEGGQWLGRRESNRDITERRRLERQLDDERQRYRLLVENSGEAVFLAQLDGTILSANPEACRMFGRSEQEICEIGRAGLIDVTDPRLAAGLKERARTGKATFEVRLVRRDGTTFAGQVSTRVYEDHLGEKRTSTVIRDLTERKQAEKEIQQRNQALDHLNDELVDEAAALEADNATITQIAATDYLTDIANRRHFSESLEKAVSLARRHGSPLALVSLDLDGLKRVNDSAGHEAGDEVLTSFADLLGSLCRAEDLPGRLGGDEFSLLLPGIDLSGACGLAERVLAAARSCEALEQRGVTVSAGVAQWSPDEHPDDLLRRADEALYAAKRGGGDAVAGGA